MSDGQVPVEVFLSYAQEDEEARTVLLKHLSGLKSEGRILLWDADQIVAGTDRATTVEKHLKRASMILLLVSANLLASHEHEIQQALERQEAGEALVLPILLHPVDLRSTPLARLQPLPRNGQPITLWTSQEAAFSAVAVGIRDALREVERRGRHARPPGQAFYNHQPHNKVSVYYSARKKLVPNQRLRWERKKRGWTQKNVADLIGLSNASRVSRWEHGITFPAPCYCCELCRIFGKSPEELGLLNRHPDEDEFSEDTDPTEAYYPLPISFTSFIGRKQDIADISRRLMRQDVRLLTLLGTGGIGKTRLAVEVAIQVCDNFPDGVCFVSLATLRDPSHVLPTIADALGIHGSRAHSLIQQVKIFLRRKQLLLLLDNFEYVVTASPVIEELLQACPMIKALVTSCQELRLQAEHLFPVPPLALPNLTNLPEIEKLTYYASIALFVQRAQIQWPNFKVTQSNAQAIAELCTRLNGLPLAIELAAARIKLLSPQELLSRLSEDMSILKSDLRNIPERQRTLYATIEWSYNLLDAGEQWLFRHLAVFAGGATLETIEDFFRFTPRRPPSLLDTIISLLAKSLLQRLDQESMEPRFAMLETIRNYGLECLKTSGEQEESWRAHAMYYLAFVEQGVSYLKGPEQSVWLMKLEREHNNLRAALRWLIEQKETELALHFSEGYGKFCGLCGYWSEEQSFLKAVLLLPSAPEQQAIRAKVLRRAGHLAYRLRELTNARQLLEESVTCSREVNDKPNLVGALGTLGRVLYRQNEILSARCVFNESIEIAYQSADDWVLANALESKGWFLHTQGQTDEAHALLEESVAICRKHLDTECLARIQTTLVMLEIAQGKREQAEMLAKESLTLAMALGTKPLIALCLDRLGDVAISQGAYDKARQYIEKRITMAIELGDTPVVVSRRLKLADIALAQGHPG